MTKAQCNAIDVRVGRRVRMTRIFRDRSIIEVARFLEVSVGEYAELEEGRRRFVAAQLMELSGLFQVNVAMFFGEPAKNDLRKYHKADAFARYWTNDNAASRSSRSE
jgi:transcriptional regulator with XRE-family HTH domain